MKNIVIALLVTLSANVHSEEEVRDYEAEAAYMDGNKEQSFAVSFIYNAKAMLEICDYQYPGKITDFKVASKNFDDWMWSIEKQINSDIVQVVYLELKNRAIAKVKAKSEMQMFPLQSCLTLSSKAVSGALPPSIQKIVNGDL